MARRIHNLFVFETDGRVVFNRTPFAGICGNLLELHSTGFCLTRGTLAGTRNTDITFRSLYNQSHLRLHPCSVFSLIISTFNPLSVYMTYSVCPDFRPSDAYMMYWVCQNFKRSCQTPGTQETLHYNILILIANILPGKKKNNTAIL